MKWLICLILAFSCAPKNEYPVPTYVPGLVQSEYTNSVRLIVVCLGGLKAGSGTIISRKHVITAKHVVTCEVGTPRRIVLIDHNHDKYDMAIDKLSTEYDIARVVTADKKYVFKTYARVSFGKFPIGTPICAVTGDAETFLIRKCGEIGVTTDDEYYTLGLHVVPGNSGSGIWDDTGAFIGVITRGRWVSDSEYIGLAIPSESFRLEMFNDLYYVDGGF